MKNLSLIFILTIFLSIFFNRPVSAQSSYVLPYPSFMPGSTFYKLNLLKEKIMKYWYFGDFGQFNYNLKLSDKYLVEAKTLFEYKQYLLGYRALQKSDSFFVKILPAIVSVKINGKNIASKKRILEEASEKHIETLDAIRNNIPNVFLWQPEKSLPTTLNLEKIINRSIQLRSEI